MFIYDIYHSKSNSLPAVENGFTMLRCGSIGESGIYEPTIYVIFNQRVATIIYSEYIFHFPIQKRRKPLYGYNGDIFGFAYLDIGLLLTFYLIYHSIQGNILMVVRFKYKLELVI